MVSQLVILNRFSYYKKTFPDSDHRGSPDEKKVVCRIVKKGSALICRVEQGVRIKIYIIVKQGNMNKKIKESGHGDFTKN